MMSAEAEIAYGEAWRASIPEEFAALPVKPPKAPKTVQPDRFGQFLREMAANCGTGFSAALTTHELICRAGMRTMFEHHGMLDVYRIGPWFASRNGKPYGSYVLCRTVRPGRQGRPKRVIWHVDILPPR